MVHKGNFNKEKSIYANGTDAGQDVAEEDCRAHVEKNCIDDTTLE